MTSLEGGCCTAAWAMPVTVWLLGWHVCLNPRRCFHAKMAVLTPCIVLCVLAPCRLLDKQRDLHLHLPMLHFWRHTNDLPAGRLGFGLLYILDVATLGLGLLGCWVVCGC